MADTANHVFLPWVASGMSADIAPQSVETLTESAPASINLPVRLTVNQTNVDKSLQLYGPGDIAGIDPDQVIRFDPLPGTSDFEPSCFPAIEFDRPELPWMFTPAVPDSQNRLRPWLCLVVVKQQEGVTLIPASHTGAAQLEIKSPAKPGKELPDLSECHLWVHAQVTGADKSTLQTTLLSSPAKTCARLLAPRRLEPNTAYIACVVPVFDAGRQAGTGQPVTQSTLKYSWASGDQSPQEVLLPVYVFWQFKTGAARDFETLARRLKPNKLPEDSGKKLVDFGDPAFAISPKPHPNDPSNILGIEGALRPLNASSDKWEDKVRKPFQSALSTILNTPWNVATSSTTNSDPILAPPIYGCWHAAKHQVTADPVSPPAWLSEINLDPRNRTIAGMGVQVIQQEQDALMASAWEQLGDAHKINQRLKQAQLARAVNTSIHTRVFSRLSDSALLTTVATARSRVTVSDGGNQMLLAQRLAISPAPIAAVSQQVRRIASPRGVLNKRLAAAGVTGIQAVFSQLNTAGQPSSAAALTNTHGAVTIDAVTSGITTRSVIVRDHTTNKETTEIFVLNPGPPPAFQRPPAGFLQMLQKFRFTSLLSASIQQLPPTNPPDLGAAIRSHHQYLTALFTTLVLKPLIRPIVTRDLKSELLASLNPAKTIVDLISNSIERGSPTPTIDDQIEPIMDAPEFSNPMYESLRDLSQDYFFPGLENVPIDTVQLLKTNERFIESFMVGLNNEMARELLWRGYPTDQRGTYFQHFWDRVPSASGAELQVDIPPIHRWGDRELGANGPGTSDDKLVLLIRGELLRRFPGTIIYAAKAVVRNGRRGLAIDSPAGVPTPLEAFPIFRGSLNPDVTFMGFDLTNEEVVGGDGWYFVLQQQPTEPRFGLDEAPFEVGGPEGTPALKTWNDLSWAHLAPTEVALEKISYVSAKSVQLKPTDPVTGIWARNAAHMAYITKQLPVRVAIHATELIRS